MSKQYQARDIEVLTGLEPVQRRHPSQELEEVANGR